MSIISKVVYTAFQSLFEETHFGPVQELEMEVMLMEKSLTKCFLLCRWLNILLSYSGKALSVNIRFGHLVQQLVHHIIVDKLDKLLVYPQLTFRWSCNNYLTEIKLFHLSLKTHSLYVCSISKLNLSSSAHCREGHQVVCFLTDDCSVKLKK